MSLQRERALTPAPAELFWYFVNERHMVWHRRHMEHRPKPWTKDPILRSFKFTNVYRELDTGTVWLRKNFLEPHRDDDPRLIYHNVCWYRMFNWRGTAELLGWQTGWDTAAVAATLRKALARGEQVFTGAHIVRSEFGRAKVDSIVDVCNSLYQARDLAVGACRRNSLEEAFDFLLRFPYVGPFMAYEIVTDLRHTRLLEGAGDVMTWANAGPGAIRGLKRLNLPATPRQEALQSMRVLLGASPKWLGSHMMRMEMRDVEHSLCEFDKYCRAKFGEGNPRSRYEGV